jgi:hypothetical protein
MLQLLASRCLLMHKQHVQQQQQQGRALIRQLGKRMRGDLLLLADPRDQLLQLLPQNKFLAADAAGLAAGDSSFGINDILWVLPALGFSISNPSASSSCNHAVLSAAALQLSVQLLRMAAAYWQQRYHSLSEQQQTLLSMGAADVGQDRLAELSRLELQLNPAQELFTSCVQLLHGQFDILWGTGQWQPQLQLLQQGGGEVLLQGLTLAVHCSSLHCQMGTLDVVGVPRLAAAVYMSAAGALGCSTLWKGSMQTGVCGLWFCAHVIHLRGMLALIVSRTTRVCRAAEPRVQHACHYSCTPAQCPTMCCTPDLCGSLADCSGRLQHVADAGAAACCCRLLLSLFPSVGTEDASLVSRRALFASQLARKHPVAFFQFVDICARSGRLDILNTDQLFDLTVTGCAKIGIKGLADLLSSPAATAALGSALCSLTKLAVQHTKKQAAAVAAAAAAAAGDAMEAEPCRVLLFSPTMLFTKLLLPLITGLPPAIEAALAAAPRSSSSSSRYISRSGRQAWASAMFLAVLVLRGFVQVHEAEASVPAAAAAGLACDAAAAPIVSTLGARVQQLMVCMLAVFRLAFDMSAEIMTKCMMECGLVAGRSSSSAVAAAPVQPEPNGSSSSSSSSSQPVRWQHLLCLYPSRKLVAAFLSFGGAWTKDQVESVLWSRKVKADAALQGRTMAEVYAAALSKEQLAEMRQLYQDALRFCMTATALAPLPVVCNNPGCGELSGVSEAAAARYVCAGCGCRYCSAACQAAGWRSHKKGCRRMAACGLRVEGK